MRIRHLLLLAVAAVLSACAAVSTHVVPLNPAQVYPPSVSVEVLLQKPARPHVEIALIEARGGSEAELLNHAREKARGLGADAIVKLETEREYYAPVAVYDPWLHDPFYWGPYRHRYWAPHPWAHPWGSYRVIPGGYEYVLKVMAVRYTDVPR